MGFASSFGPNNSGIQIGVNNGSINLNLDEELPTVDEAAFDSYDHQHEERCLPGTRIDILCQIKERAFSPQGRCIFWLNGMAGTGKSTISRTVAESFSEEKSLGASFFFKRGEADRGSAKRLFPTIARQLTISIPQLLPYIKQAVLDNSGIIGKGLKEQFDKLLLQPLLSLRQSDLPVNAFTIVIDALDECEGDNDIRLILQLLPQLQKLDTLRIRVLLTSRPELPIRLGFSEIAIQDHKDLILHEISEEVIKHDISLFLHHRLSKIRNESFLPDDWPGDKNLEKLVALSIPLFIFAATICRIFADPNWDPIDSLTEILAYRLDQSNMDRTYLPVLDRLLSGQTERQEKQLVKEFQQVVGSIVILESPLSVISLSKLLNLPERLIQLRLKPLYSVLKIPTDRTLPVRLFHLSFRDFLLDSETCGKTPFSVDGKAAHYKLTIQCLLMCQNLQKNICELPTDGTYRTEIDSLAVNQYIPSELQYSCRYWVYHLSQCNNLSDVIHQAFLFLQEHFLHWVEAMCLLGLVSDIIGMLNLLQAAIPGDQHSAMSDFLQDAKRFTLKNRQIADKAPLQIYSAGLIFAPKESIIREKFKGELPSWIYQLPRVEESWGAEIQKLEGHSHEVNSVAFSHDSQLLASASYDQTVRLWGPATGVLLQTLEGHSEGVMSVAFSHDDRLLASASYDKTVRLWNPATGELQQTLKGHSGWVISVAFSHDSWLLASASYDQTIRLWDPATGVLQQILKGHSGWISSVAFSPNNRLLASASVDNTIRLWDLAAGVLQQTLESYWIISVAFSPDSRLLASASYDQTVRLWDPATGALLQTLKGHSSGVSSVAFLYNGQLASASHDQTIRLWDPATGALQRILKGHSRAISSVAFSPDGQLLASASGDLTVGLWDLATRVLQQTLKGHSRAVSLVAFSHNGRLLASVSDDRTIGLWDPATGILLQTLEGHSNGIMSVAFSHDDRLLASAWYDHTVRLWDTATGGLHQTLERNISCENLAFSHNGQLLASALDDHTIRLWDPATGVLQQTLEGHSGFIGSIAFSPDGQLLASGSGDSTVRLWNTATGSLQYTLEAHSDFVNSVVFSYDGQLMASASNDCTVRLWDPATGVLQQTLEGYSRYVLLVALSHDGRLLASFSEDFDVQLWNLSTGTVQQVLKVDGEITYLEFSRDGCYLNTNFGLLDARLSRENHASQNTYERSWKIFIEQGQWIKVNGNKTLWLPPECRPRSSAIHDNLLALGDGSGRISFLGFYV